ncbi:hypothetical protein [Acidiferrobacter sp. SPIII_3]|uniref:hypothetical protein n=1 Tax=Acidiferrobacter sp. SPIII_3 TaxID=1281578 RepID=UPI00197AF3EC|nr:hypothetical protein [Acidiferrobacter sp. SPIII_3]
MVKSHLGTIEAREELRTLTARRHWRDAWIWAMVKSHLGTIEAREELRTLTARRQDLEHRLAHLYETLVSKSAWLSTKLGASPKVLAALETYRTAVRRIGKGTL